MFSFAFNRPLAAIAVVGGLLVAAAPAGADVRNAGNTAYAQPEIGDEVLAYEPRAPRADGIIAILIGAVGTNDIEQDN